MFYAFLLFWPANVIPIWLLITLLQFFIPLNMLMRSCCVGKSHYKTHVISGFIILSATAVNLVDLANDQYRDLYMKYALLFLTCSLCDVASHSLKESIVRSQPLDQERFNFRISVSQFIVGVVIAPFVLMISREYEDYSQTPLSDDQNLNTWEFIGRYFAMGFDCVFSGGDNPDNFIQDNHCNWAWIPLLGYVLALFALQLSITILMQHKKTKNARLSFAFMVPITVAAFLFGSLTEPNLISTGNLEVYDIVALVLATVGVFGYNWFEEKPQKASIETL